MPTVVNVKVSVATPDAFKLLVPSSVAPLKKLTVPSDEPVGAGVTVAVSVTCCPAAAVAAGLDTSVVVVTVGGVAFSGTVVD